MKARRHSQGLTLMEVLVALIIAGTALALGFQALGQWDRAQKSFGLAERRAREAALTEAWVREAMRSAILRPSALLPNGQRTEADIFRGSTRRVEFISLAPLLGERGTPTRQMWELNQDGGQWKLVNLTSNQPPIELPAKESVRFVYVDREGRSAERWPTNGEEELMPTIFGLVVDNNVWLEAPQLRPETIPYELLSE